jgi:hypothetical protein
MSKPCRLGICGVERVLGCLLPAAYIFGLPCTCECANLFYYPHSLAMVRYGIALEHRTIYLYNMYSGLQQRFGRGMIGWGKATSSGAITTSMYLAATERLITEDLR